MRSADAALVGATGAPERIAGARCNCIATQGKPQRNVEPTIARRGPGPGGEDPSPLSRSRM
jgi:hypothetical protein